MHLREGSRGTSIEASRFGRLWSLAELGLFIALAFAAGWVQVFVLSPNMTLLFDSQGYLAVANSLLSALGPEAQRLPLADIAKTGPVVPAILATVYALGGKAIAQSNWMPAALSMIALFATTVGAGFWTSLRLFGPATARLTGVFMLLYPGFLVNCGRPLSELPALAIEAVFFALLANLLIYKEGIHKDTLLKTLAPLFGLGVCGGLLMLARPTLLPLVPLLFVPVAFARYLAGRASTPGSSVVALVAGVAVVLAGWAGLKWTATGVPSITVDRYGAYNLYAGCSVKSDGWDVLPGEYVSHPDRFKKSMSETGAEVFDQAMQNVPAALNLAARKPARLLGAPWNDFQISCLGVPWLAQRFFHQLLLMAAFFGFWELIERGLWRARPRYQAEPDGNDGFAELACAGVFGLTIAYHLICCIFITMSRYFVTAMVPVIILAAFGFWRLKSADSQRRSLIAVASLLVPFASTLFEWLTGNGALIFTDLVRDNGQSMIALVCSTLFAVSIGVSMWLLSLESKGALRWASGSMIVLSVVTAFASCSRTMNCATTYSVLPPDRERRLSCVLPETAKIADRWYLVIDAPRDRRWQPAAPDQLKINGSAVNPDWRPLLALDASQRENLTYATAFAYSGGKEIESGRQWLVLPLPAGLIKPEKNEVSLSCKQELLLPADVFEPGKTKKRQLSLRNFSWSKGYFADSPGEARMDEWHGVVPQAESAPRVLPRVMLLSIASQTTGNKSAPVVISLPDQHVDKVMANRVREIPIDTAKIAACADSSCALRLRLTGTVNSVGAPASCGVVESLAVVDNGELSEQEEFAPTAPLKLRNGSFQIDETIPLKTAAGLPRHLDKVRLLFAARPWWEVLCYGNFKASGKADFTNLKLSAVAEPSVDLDKEKWESYPLLPVSY